MVLPDDQTERRLTPKGRATRERIVLAAAELIVAHGLRALNMDGVRRAASVSGSQLAHYFADKSALIRAVVARQIAVVLAFHEQPKLGGLRSFADFERWAELNMRYLRRVASTGTPTYHALAAQLAKSDDATRMTLGAGYLQWIKLLEKAIQQMKDGGVLLPIAEPTSLATVIVSAHQGGGTLSYTYRAEWPHADATRCAVNYLRMFAADPAERSPRPVRQPRGRRGRTRASRPAVAEDPHFTRKGLATRARIVEAAARLMFERGVDNTSIEEVRTTAGVGGSQISHYFGDKRDLTRQVIASRRSDVVTFHTQPRLGALDSVAALQSWADACIADIDAVYRIGGCVYGSLAGELIDADDDIHDDLSAGYDEWIELFREGLEAMRRRGDLRADADPRHLAVSLVTVHQGGAMLTHAIGDPQPLRVAVNAGVDYVRSFARSDKDAGRSSRRRSKA
ncbi:TetR family transcriptional regulator [Mycobacterium intermedium]|uniref:TetR family transcriptional regulator n=1 Tax=Mycobacterium intermedium TaxID=28445 RepID=A0A1E3SDI4_MYCIE|nr:TetR/AcrR family transcriptional regulator [Mycobacterium intermedium]MCV6963998.1 TetR/AcrR family transcriptional regulator [Mycobacterium intermedium]ODR00190.1 TetR family transcriptional regulator [Mycobacterium intermedium]OPE51807.1 TetR family transcriptional regulator [Mycobacterium intermedium]ORB07874.1 TetR family transcriptional regulator [Mycobacterium intermedium]